jgi:hypothetical protein
MKRAVEVSDLYEASKLALRMLSDLDAYANHNGPDLCAEHQRLAAEFHRGDEERMYIVGLAMAFGKRHFPNLKTKRIPDPPKLSLDAQQNLINTFVDGLLPTSSSLDYETRVKVLDKIVAKYTKPASPNEVARQRWAKQRPIRAVVVEAATHNLVLAERLHQECALLDVVDRNRVDHVLTAICDLGEAIQRLEQVDNPSWSLGEEKRDAIQRQVLSVLKPKG